MWDSNTSSAWKSITQRIHAQPSIDELADEIYEKLSKKDFEGYVRFSEDCMELMCLMANCIARMTISSGDYSGISRIGEMIQSFACATLSDIGKFQKFVLSFTTRKRLDGKCIFSNYFLGCFNKYFNHIVSEEDTSSVKERSVETKAFWYTLKSLSQTLFDKDDPKLLNKHELEILLAEIQHNVRDMKTYSLYELTSYIQGREGELPTVTDKDGEETTVEPAAPDGDPAFGDDSYIFQIFAELVSNKKVRFSEEELDRAFVKLLCNFSGDYILLVRHASWLTEEKKRSIIGILDKYYAENDRAISVKKLAEPLGIYTNDAVFTQAMDKLRKLLANHPDIPSEYRKIVLEK